MEPLNVRYERRRVSTLCWGLSLMLVVTLAADVILIWLAARVNPLLALSSEGMNWIAAAAQFGLGYPVCLLVMTRVPADPMERFRLRSGQIRDAVLACCFMLLAGNLVGLAVNGAISEALGYETSNLVDEALGSSTLLYNLLTTVIAAPIFEEWICRRCLIDRLNRLGDRPAILVSAFLFALVHGNFYQFFYAFGVGLVFGYIYVRTGRLRYTVALHMAVNLCFGVLPDVCYDMGGNFAVAVWELILIAGAVAGLVRFIVRWRRRRLLRGWIALPGNRYGYIVFANVGMAVCLILCVLMFIINLS